MIYVADAVRYRWMQVDFIEYDRLIDDLQVFTAPIFHLDAAFC